jgi:hypothetical protein
MMLEQVVQRNRLRAVALALLAGLNAWLVVSLLMGAALWLATSELGVGTAPVVVTALVVGGLGTGVLLRHALRVRSRIVESLGAIELAPGDIPRVDVRRYLGRCLWGRSTTRSPNRATGC